MEEQPVELARRCDHQEGTSLMKVEVNELLVFYSGWEGQVKTVVLMFSRHRRGRSLMRFAFLVQGLLFWFFVESRHSL